MDITPTQQVEILRASCCIAAADGEVTPVELEVLKQIAHNHGGVGQASLEAMIDRSLSDSAFCQQQFNILRAKPLACLDVLLSIALANGELKESEFGVLKNLAGRLGISEADFRERVTQAAGSSGDSA